MRAKRIVVTLDPAEYAVLERLGEREDRDGWQQARWLLRRAIAEAQQAGEAERYPARAALIRGAGAED